MKRFVIILFILSAIRLRTKAFGGELRIGEKARRLIT